MVNTLRNIRGAWCFFFLIKNRSNIVFSTFWNDIFVKNVFSIWQKVLWNILYFVFNFIWYFMTFYVDDTLHNVRCGFILKCYVQCTLICGHLCMVERSLGIHCSMVPLNHYEMYVKRYILGSHFQGIQLKDIGNITIKIWRKIWLYNIHMYSRSPVEKKKFFTLMEKSFFLPFPSSPIPCRHRIICNAWQ